jgi:restriction system protein
LTPREYEDFLADLYGQLSKGLPAEVFLRRKYSGASGQLYEIDLSIEFLLLGVRYLTLVEAKHYLNRIAVGEVLEFSAKLTDIGAHKGIMVTTSGFQVGAQVIASSRGIALVVVAPGTGARPRAVLEKPGDDASHLDDASTLASTIRQILDLC